MAIHDGATARKLKAIPGGKGKAASLVSSAVRTLDLEVEGLQAVRQALEGSLAGPVAEALRLLKEARGRVIVSGIGKSGHVGQKVAATFASTGTPAFFVHPSEASHGDLGMITRDDVILALSWSGETVELLNIITYSRRFAVPLISITSRADSALGKQSDVVLELPRAKEGLPARARADDVDDHAARARRQPRHCSARVTRVHGTGFQDLPSGRLARRLGSSMWPTSCTGRTNCPGARDRAHERRHR